MDDGSGQPVTRVIEGQVLAKRAPEPPLCSISRITESASDISSTVSA